MKEEQILKRWKRLIKGLLIREKLQEKYNLDVSKCSSLCLLLHLINLTKFTYYWQCLTFLNLE